MTRGRRSARLGAAGLLLGFLYVVGAGSALGQPKGPADIISGARQARAEQELTEAGERADKPAGSPASDPAARGDAGTAAAGVAPALPAGHPPATRTARSPHDRSARQRKPISQGRPDRRLAKGEIRVRVVDQDDNPVPNQQVRLGVLRSDGGRESKSGRTDASGIYAFRDLPVGDRQAYRTEVRADGAAFASNPFRLPHDRGYRVTLRRLPVTRDNSKVVLYVGAVSVELKEERLKLAQHLRLINVGSDVYAFPEAGLTIPLPEGFTAFQAEETMGDQEITSNDTGVHIQGSLPPGQTTLLWGFDLPIDGTEMTVEFENPWTTYAMRVLADAAPGLSLSVDGMPPAERHERNGSAFWVTEAAAKPGQAPAWDRLRIRLNGIPGPGPGRWIASSLALLLVAIGFVISRRPSAPTVSPRAALQQRKAQLLEELAALRQEHAQGEVGPETFADERTRLTDALAVILWEEDQLRSG